MQVAREFSLEQYGALRSYGPEQDRRLRVAAPAARPAHPPLVLIGAGFLIWAFLVGLGVVYVYREAGIVRQGRELEALRAKIGAVEEENSALAAQVASLSSIQRIEREARRLGLVPPTGVKVAAVDRAAVMAAMRPAPESSPVRVAAAEQEFSLWDWVTGYLARWRADPARDQAAPRR